MDLTRETKLAETLKTFYIKTDELSDFLRGDVELYSNEYGNLIEVLMDLLEEKGVFTNFDLIIDYCSSKITFKEALIITNYKGDIKRVSNL